MFAHIRYNADFYKSLYIIVLTTGLILSAFGY